MGHEMRNRTETIIEIFIRRSMLILWVFFMLIFPVTLAFTVSLYFIFISPVFMLLQLEEVMDYMCGYYEEEIENKGYW